MHALSDSDGLVLTKEKGKKVLTHTDASKRRQNLKLGNENYGEISTIKLFS